MREITIRTVLNGFVVQVGCQTVVFENKDTMLTEIGRYISDPDGVEKDYIAKSINSNVINMRMRPDGQEPVNAQMERARNYQAAT